ncbi:hypothetical protein ACS0TY_007296 [Phlomoides rotata]
METITKGSENGKLQLTNGEKVIRKKNVGGWRSAKLLLANQALATLSFFGVGVNLVLFLTRVLRQDNATAANNVSMWTGTVYLCSLFGAFLSDSYLGRYATCALSQLVLLLGLVLLSISSGLMLLHPKGCGDGKLECNPNTTLGIVIFYVAIYLVALGYGGHQPTVATFGADQFKEEEKDFKSAFFCYFYFSLNVGSLFSNTILVYFEDKGQWSLGFGLATASAVVGLVVFLVGFRGYKYVQPSGNPIPRVAQVFCSTIRKWNVSLKEGEALYEVQGSESAIKGSRKIMHTDEFRCLDKAAIMTERDRCGDPANGWRLCSVTQVEEAKCIIRMLPIWVCTIIYSVVFTQMASLFVEQGAVMHSYISGFHIPAASMSVFDICSVLLCTGIYRRILVPIAEKLSGNVNGLTELQRMGVGLIIGMLAMVVAGLTEVERLRRIVPGERVSTLSIFWQVPQYVLVGASEVFMYVGQLEFFNEQAPDGIKSFGSSLCMASMSLGNFVSSLLVSFVMKVTDGPGWIPEDLNEGHMEKFYFLIAGLCALDFFFYVLCAKRYNKCSQVGETAENVSKISYPEEVVMMDRV